MLLANINLSNVSSSNITNLFIVSLAVLIDILCAWLFRSLIIFSFSFSILQKWVVYILSVLLQVILRFTNMIYYLYFDRIRWDRIQYCTCRCYVPTFYPKISRFKLMWKTTSSIICHLYLFNIQHDSPRPKTIWLSSQKNLIQKCNDSHQRTFFSSGQPEIIEEP